MEFYTDHFKDLISMLTMANEGSEKLKKTLVVIICEQQNHRELLGAQRQN